MGLSSRNYRAIIDHLQFLMVQDKGKFMPEIKDDAFCHDGERVVFMQIQPHLHHALVPPCSSPW